MKNFIRVILSVALALSLLPGCSQANDAPRETTITLDVVRPRQGRSIAYRLPVGEFTEREALARRSELLGRYNEAAMYDALASAADGDIREKIEIVCSAATDTEYRISIPALLGATDKDHFLWPESAGQCVEVVATKTFTLHRAVARPVAGLPDEEKQRIETAIQSLNLYYLCTIADGETRIIARLVGGDDEALRKAAMEIVIADGRLGAIKGVKNLRD